MFAFAPAVPEISFEQSTYKATTTPGWAAVPLAMVRDGDAQKEAIVMWSTMAETATADIDFMHVKDAMAVFKPGKGWYHI